MKVTYITTISSDFGPELRYKLVESAGGVLFDLRLGIVQKGEHGSLSGRGPRGHSCCSG